MFWLFNHPLFAGVLTDIFTSSFSTTSSYMLGVVKTNFSLKIVIHKVLIRGFLLYVK